MNQGCIFSYRKQPGWLPILAVLLVFLNLTIFSAAYTVNGASPLSELCEEEQNVLEEENKHGRESALPQKDLSLELLSLSGGHGSGADDPFKLKDHILSNPTPPPEFV